MKRQVGSSGRAGLNEKIFGNNMWSLESLLIMVPKGKEERDAISKNFFQWYHKKGRQALCHCAVGANLVRRTHTECGRQNSCVSQEASPSDA